MISNPGSNVVLLAWSSRVVQVLAVDLEAVRVLHTGTLAHVVSKGAFSVRGNYVLLAFTGHEHLHIHDALRGLHHVGTVSVPGVISSLSAVPSGAKGSSTVWITSHTTDACSSLVSFELPVEIGKDLRVPNSSARLLIDSKVRKMVHLLPVKVGVHVGLILTPGPHCPSNGAVECRCPRRNIDLLTADCRQSR